MADQPGAHAALAIEAVEWAPGDGDKLIIRVRGRWRRRRPDWRGQPVLVIEAAGSRHRFPAIPEPPSLTGAPPGGWEMTFSIPAWLAPHLGERVWLQLGLAVIPLAAPSGPPVGTEPATGPPGGADAETLVERRARTAELTAQRARTRQAEAEAALADKAIRVEQLEQELKRASREPERLRRLLAERDRHRRLAEQRAHAEESLRLELQDAIDAGEFVGVPAHHLVEAAELAEAEARVRELKDQLDAVRWRAPPAPERPPPAPRAFDLGAEMSVAAAARRVAPVRRAPARLVPGVVELRALSSERRLVRPRAGVEAAPTAPQQLAEILAALRAEFEELTAIAEREHVTRVAAEQRVAEVEAALRDREVRSTRVSDAVHELRGLLDQVRGEGPGAGLAARSGAGSGAGFGAGLGAEPGSGAGSGVEPERFDAALVRLRASTPAEPESAPPGEGPPTVKPWLTDAFARLVARDAELAGRLLLGLLPAQGAVHSAAVAYDLVLADDVAIQLTLAEPPATPAIVTAPTPRDLAAVAFRATGDHAAIARLVYAGTARRLFRRGRARVDGQRRQLAALVDLVRSPLSLDELYGAGVRLEPELALLLAAAMVRPEWTATERFTIAHLDGGPAGPATYLHVRRGEPLTVTDSPPLGPVATTIVCPGELLLAVLAGRLDAGASISGDPAPLLGLLGWLERAQRG
jgi:hypothetical protein